jgi:hypothetical protein
MQLMVTSMDLFKKKNLSRPLIKDNCEILIGAALLVNHLNGTEAVTRNKCFRDHTEEHPGVQIQIECILLFHHLLLVPFFLQKHRPTRKDPLDTY